MITIRNFLQADSEFLPPELEAEITSLQKHLSLITKNEVLNSKSKSIQRSLAEYKGVGLKETSSSVKPGSGAKLPANLRLDKILSTADNSEYLNIELCFNNKETAGTNFLKLSSAAIFQERQGALFSLGLLLVPSRELLTLGGWDPVYGDSTEYSLYYKEAFKQSLFGRYLILELSSSFLNFS
jgi:hypothetical protein